MTLQDAELDALWDHLWGLEDRINHGETLELSARMRDLLLSAAPTVAISSAGVEAALATTESATALLLEIRKRIREGSNRACGARRPPAGTGCEYERPNAAMGWYAGGGTTP